MRNGVVAYLSNAVASTLAVFVLIGWIPDKVASALVVCVAAWAGLVVYLNDRRQ